MFNTILPAFGIDEKKATVVAFGSGLINNTWLVKNGQSSYILQRINHTIFRNPEAIAKNIGAIAAYLSQHSPGYFFVAGKKNIDGNDLCYLPREGYFRMFPFVQQSHTIDVVNNPSQAFEAAQQFGRFTKMLAGFPAHELHITLPDFHNLELRYQQFKQAVLTGNNKRIAQSKGAIAFLQQQVAIVDTYTTIRVHPEFKVRVTHHDTKISNVLFDEQEKGLCVIDLDTVMPGYFISDVGDMLRTYLSPVSEEEADFSKISIRDDYFKAIADGYLGEMGTALSREEKQHFVYAGKFMIYMQALRFLTDYLNNDVYYGAKYEEHNFVRAGNQIVLLQRLTEKEAALSAMVT